MIYQLLDTLEFISWDTESQPASSEEEEKEERKDEELEQEQRRGFINIITDVFDYLEEVSDNNWMFRALSYTTFGSSKYHAEVRAQVVAYMTARSDRFSAGYNDFENYLILLRDYQAWVDSKNYRHLLSYMRWTLMFMIEWHPQIPCITFHQE